MMNGILLEQGFLGDCESPNHRAPPHRGGRRLLQKPPSLLGGSSLKNSRYHEDTFSQSSEGISFELISPV
jgi:hypothetical protein